MVHDAVLERFGQLIVPIASDHALAAEELALVRELVAAQVAMLSTAQGLSHQAGQRRFDQCLLHFRDRLGERLVRSIVSPR